MRGKQVAAILAAMLASVALTACGLSMGPESGANQGGSPAGTPVVAGERRSQPEGSTGPQSSVLTNDDWAQVEADPDRYKGTPVDITGEVFNLLADSDNYRRFQIYTDPNGRKGNAHVAIQNLSRPLEAGYQVRVTGTLKGTRVARSVSGRELRLPEVEADRVEVVGPPSVVTPTAIPSPTVEPSPTPTPTPRPTQATRTPTAAPTAAPTRAAGPTAAPTRAAPTTTPTRNAAPTATATRPAGPAATTGPQATTPPVAGGQLPIYVPAASAQLSGPMKAAGDPGAPSGRYLTTSATNQQWNGQGSPPATGEGVLQIEVPRDGTYAVWSRMWYTGADGNSYWLVVDDQSGIKVGNEDRGYSQWKWIGWHDGDPSNRVTVELTAGVHTFRLIGREANARVDSLLVTDDLTYVPK